MSSYILAKNPAALEERMNTKQQEYKTDMALLREDLAKRDTRLLLAMAGMLAFGITTLGLPIRL